MSESEISLWSLIVLIATAVIAVLGLALTIYLNYRKNKQIIKISSTTGHLYDGTFFEEGHFNTDNAKGIEEKIKSVILITIINNSNYASEIAMMTLVGNNKLCTLPKDIYGKKVCPCTINAHSSIKILINSYEVLYDICIIDVYSKTKNAEQNFKIILKTSLSKKIYGQLDMHFHALMRRSVKEHAEYIQSRKS